MNVERFVGDFVVAIDFGGTKIAVAIADLEGEILEQSRIDRVLLAPNVPGWEQLALQERVRDGLEIAQVAVGTDVKAAAAAEVRWGSLKEVDPGVFLSLGTGVAAALGPVPFTVADLAVLPGAVAQVLADNTSPQRLAERRDR